MQQRGEPLGAHLAGRRVREWWAADSRRQRAVFATACAQAGRLAPSVEDILHLEKRWNKLPGASAGSVALEDVTALLGAEVLAVSRLLPLFATFLGSALGAASGASRAVTAPAPGTQTVIPDSVPRTARFLSLNAARFLRRRCSAPQALLPLTRSFRPR